ELRSNEDFFARGGDSLVAMKLVLLIEDAFGMRLKGDLVDSLTSPAAMAASLRGSLAPAAAPVADTGERRIEGILQQQRRYLAGWRGARSSPERLVVTLNRGGAGPSLFWCFQSYDELAALAAALGRDIPLHGMRSGHMVMDYTPETIAALAGVYCDEIIAL